MRFRRILKKTWHFIWHEDSLLSWIVNIILAFILVKFIIYPGIGFVLSTSHPLVAVVSGSMEHNNLNFDEWWDANKDFYLKNDFTKEQFQNFPSSNGFNRGDIMMLRGVKPKDIKMGSIIVYKSNQINPIIHRVVKIEKENNKFYFQTKGDNNPTQDPKNIAEEQIIGRAIFRVPFLGWIKIWFTDLVNLFR